MTATGGPGPGGTPGPDAGSDTGLEFEVDLRVDGHSIPLKEFIHDMVGGAVCGLVSGLRGVDGPEAVEIRVRRI